MSNILHGYGRFEGFDPSYRYLPTGTLESTIPQGHSRLEGLEHSLLEVQRISSLSITWYLGLLIRLRSTEKKKKGLDMQPSGYTMPDIRLTPPIRQNISP